MDGKKQEFVGEFDNSHRIWVPEDSLFVPFPGEVGLEVLRAFLQETSGDTRTANGLIEFDRRASAEKNSE